MAENSFVKISIIIPVFNADKVLEKCLESILNQSFTTYEIIILDNASADNSLSIARRYALSTTPIKIYSEKDDGIYYAMNKGITLAKGAWIYFMGADDSFVDNEVLKNISDYLTIENDIVYGNVIWMPDFAKEEGQWDYSTFLKQNINHQRIFYQKNLFERCGFFNTDYKVASDHELNIRFFCNDSIQKKYVDIDVAYYASDGFSANKIDELFWDNWKQLVYKNFKSHLPKKTIYSSFASYCRYNLYKHKYAKAIKNICIVFIHTQSFGFLKLMGSHFIKSLYKKEDYLTPGFQHRKTSR